MTMRRSTIPITLLFTCLLLCAPRAGGETIAEIRVHGNHTTPDEEIVQLAGVTVGQPVTAATVAEMTQRLRASRRFERVEIRKRYRSLTDPTQVALIVLVQEYPSADTGLPVPGVPRVPIPGPLRRLRNATMLMPVLEYVDGYGLTYGGRASFVDLFGPEGRISVPLTWGGTRRAAVEIEKGFTKSPVGRVVSRIHGGAAIARVENPHFDLPDRRQRLWIGVDRKIVEGLRAGVQGGWTDVGFGRTSDDAGFGRIDDRFTSLGADVTLDTRHDPIFPRNAIFARVGWEALRFDRGVTRGGDVAPGDRNIDPTVDRLVDRSVGRAVVDLRGYVGVIGQTVLSARARFDRATGPLPPYEQALLGGAASLRGYRAGAFAGDNRFISSLELRTPLTSPMRIGRLGARLFADAGTAYDHGVRLRDASFHEGVGAGLFLFATVFQLNVDVAKGLDAGTRVHVMTGFQW